MVCLNGYLLVLHLHVFILHLLLAVVSQYLLIQQYVVELTAVYLLKDCISVLVAWDTAIAVLLQIKTLFKLG